MNANLYVPRDLVKSRAFLALSGKSPQVLLIFFTKRQVEKLKRPGPRGERFRIVNNGQLVFTYRDAERDYELSTKTFRHAIDDLVRVGFLDIKKHGGGLEGDRSLYALGDRWRAYGTSAFQPAERPKGRPWPTRATSLKGRAPASLKGRASPATASLKGRGSPPKPTAKRVLQGTCSIESTSPSPRPAKKEGGGGRGMTLDLGESLRLALGREPTAKERISFDQAVGEARTAGAPDALIAHFVRKTPVSEGVWAGPNAARGEARRLVESWANTGLEPRRESVQAIIKDVLFAEEYMRLPDLPSWGTGRARNGRVLAWAEWEASALRAAGFRTFDTPLRAREAAQERDCAPPEKGQGYAHP